MQQDYRACGNFVQANTRIRPPAFQIPDCAATLDMMEGCSLYSAFDIKAGFLNIEIAPEC